MKNIRGWQLLVFIVAYSLFLGAAVVVLKKNTDAQINTALQEQLHYLRISYRQGLDRFQMIADNVYASTVEDPILLDALDRARSATREERDRLRQRLYRHFRKEYRRLQKLGVRQWHFFFPDNRTFLRMHQPDRYGDDVTDDRYSVTYANLVKQPARGFEEGRSSHGFRNLYPVFKEGRHIGAFDISFSPTKLQDYTMRAADIHTHFIIDRKIFRSLAWQSRILEKFEPSIEHADFVYTMSDHIEHKRLQETEKLVILPLREQVCKKMAGKEAFALYRELESSVKVVAFLPVETIKGDKVGAYFVSYTSSKQIADLLFAYRFNLFLAVGVITLLFLLVYWNLVRRDALRHALRYDTITEVYNRHYFLQKSREAYTQAVRQGSEFSIVLMGVDAFKQLTDLCGHKCTDALLREIAAIIVDNLWTNDTVGRYGGEVFSLLMPSDEYNAHRVTEKIRRKIEQYPFSWEGSAINLTVSCGIVQYHHDANLDALIRRAETALLKAKRGGPNRIAFA